MQLNPAHAGAASSLGVLLTDDDEFEEAELVLFRAIEHNPEDVSLRINYGKLLSDKYEHDLATEQYKIVFVLATGSPDLLYNYVNALKDEGQVDESIASCPKSVEVKPDFENACAALLSRMI